MFRCVDAEAYEVKREDVSNGIFISFLKRRVCEDEKVTVMLDRVAEGMYSAHVNCEALLYGGWGYAHIYNAMFKMIL